MSGSLLATRRFAPLFWCQFFSAFSDNFLKNALVFLILFKMGGSQGEALISLAAAIFIFPFFILSGLGGQMADRYDKSLVAQRLKFAEIGAAVLAVVGFAMQSVPVLFAALLLFGIISALFGPIKYGILPDHLKREELPAANALVEGATFIAILLGTIVGGIAMQDGGHPVILGAMIIVFSLMCWGSSLLIPRTGEAAPTLTVRANIFASTWALIRHLRSDYRLWWGGLTVSWFWLAGVVALSLLPPLVKNVLGGDELVVTACLAIFSVAIAVGSGLAAKILAGRLLLTPTYIGAVLIAVFAIDLGFTTWGQVPTAMMQDIGSVFATSAGIHVAIDLAGLAIAGGLFVVPVFAAVQAWAGADYRARTIAAVNVLNAAFMAMSTVIIAVLQTFGLTPSQLFVALGVLTLIAAGVIYTTRPQRTDIH